MKRLLTRLMTLLTLCAYAGFNSVTVYAAGEGINTAEFKTWANNYLSPISTILLWACPICTGIYLIWSAIKWYGKEAEGEQQRPYWVIVKNGLIVGVLATSVSLLLKIFSIQ